MAFFEWHQAAKDDYRNSTGRDPGWHFAIACAIGIAMSSVFCCYVIPCWWSGRPWPDDCNFTLSLLSCLFVFSAYLIGFPQC